MKMKNKIKIGMFLLFGVFLLGSILGASVSSVNYGSNPNYGAFPEFSSVIVSGSDSCSAGDDFVLQIAPFGCEPAVVRSDLLEEQNVPVFCQIAATQINPLIDVEAIEGMTLIGKYSSDVTGVAFYPANAALGVSGDLNTPVLENIGYAVIVLKKQTNASLMPDYVMGNLTARLKYDIKNVYGIGNALFYLPVLSDSEWENNKEQYSFWNGKGFIRAESIGTDYARIVLYDAEGDRVSSIDLDKGKTSSDITLADLDSCLGTFKIKLNSLDAPITRAKLDINGDIVEVGKNERFLDNKCVVKKLYKNGLNSEVTINCREDSDSGFYGSSDFTLKISPSIKLIVNDESYIVGIGEKIGNTDIVLKKIDSSMKNNVEIKNSIITLSKDGVSRELKYSDGEKGLFEDNIKIKIENYVGNIDYSEGVNENYYLAKQDYEEIINGYGSLLVGNSKISYGEEALFNEIKLAAKSFQHNTRQELCEEFENSYDASKVSEWCSNFYNSNSEISSRTIAVNGELKNIELKGIYEPDSNDYNAEIMMRKSDGTSEEINLGSNDIKYFKDGSSEYIQLLSLDDNSAKVEVHVQNSESKWTTKTLNLELNKLQSVESYGFTLTNIKLQKVANVELIPNINNVGSESSFAFKIGIEKRSIELSPEKIEEKLKNLNDTIEKWNKISDNLEVVVEGLKGACLATGAFFTIRNLLGNLGGESIARQEVMRGEGGWYKKCQEAISTKNLDGKAVDYVSIDECFFKNAKQIDEEVEQRYSYMKKQEKDIEVVENLCDKKEFITETQINAECFKTNYLSSIKRELGECSGKVVIDSKTTVLCSEIVDMISSEKISVEDLRELQLNYRMDDEDKLNKILKNIYINNIEEEKLNTFKEATGFPEHSGTISTQNLKEMAIYSFLDYSAISDKYKIVDGQTNIGNSEHVYFLQDISSGAENYVLVYNDEGTVLRTYSIASDKSLKIYTGNDKKSSSNNPFGIKFKLYDAKAYNNKFIASYGEEGVVIKYYETEPYAGYPAVVPFDLDNGWYVYIKQATGALGGVSGDLKSYDDSGALRNYYICNVGKDGREDNMGDDDICRSINVGTGQSYDVFPGYSGNVKTLISCAEQAVKSAAKQYGDSNEISISTSCDSFKVKVGNPAVDIPDISCSDLMSPSECKVLFNVCDPVICPSSRCNYGGTYFVKDVIQSGIIGSVFLCLPNYKQGIIVPVCLSGIKAGIDGWLSVYKTYQDCLQTALDTGETVGICDEIYSIHLCEFFWRQGLPLAQITLPKILEMATGQNIRGGGEYLGVASAWETASKSVDYFVNYYAVNSYKAFKARSAEDVGDEVCQNFASGVSASGESFFDTLIEADSPVQFHGKFEEIEFTSATVPAMSQYKVTYHIYAGEDSGVYYQVYLDESEESAYYQDSNYRKSVASGYIAQGEYKTDSVDFTAPSGYKKLCMVVNGQKECGFGQVSTSFAVNYIKDEYVSSQVTDETIDSEADCVSGTSSVYSLFNLNLQSAIEDVIDPEIYNEGIIRICASQNPGLGTDSKVNTNSSRWVEVGTCDDNLNCYLDTDSVKDVIKSLQIEGDTLSEVNSNAQEILKAAGEVVDFDKVQDEINQVSAEDLKGKVEVISKYINKLYFDNQRVWMLLERANAYAELASIEVVKVVDEKLKNSGDLTDATEKSKESGDESLSVSEGKDDKKEESKEDIDENVQNIVSKTCRQEVGEDIVKIIREMDFVNSYSIDEDKIKSDTGVNSFECLVLMQAIQESDLSHCKNTENRDNCLDCDGELNDVLSGDDGKSLGVMQINTDVHKDADYSDFSSNVLKGASYLIDSYNYCKNNQKTTSWKAALSRYNGLGCKEDTDYSKKVLEKKDEVEELFEGVC